MNDFFRNFSCKTKESEFENIFHVDFHDEKENSMENENSFPAKKYFFKENSITKHKLQKNVSIVNENLLHQRKIVFHLNIFPLPEDNEVTIAERIFRQNQKVVSIVCINSHYQSCARPFPAAINSPTVFYGRLRGKRDGALHINIGSWCGVCLAVMRMCLDLFLISENGMFHPSKNNYPRIALVIGILMNKCVSRKGKLGLGNRAALRIYVWLVKINGKLFNVGKLKEISLNFLERVVAKTHR